MSWHIQGWMLKITHRHLWYGCGGISKARRMTLYSTWPLIRLNHVLFSLCCPRHSPLTDSLSLVTTSHCITTTLCLRKRSRTFLALTWPGTVGLEYFFWRKYFVKSRQLLVGMNISSLTTMLAQADRLLCCWPVKYRLAGINIKILLKHIQTPI